ncbi:MAG: DUF748 domain-containing protein [Tatlockia sp.]|nr:DUF748 domain-containing protein [Tatlockia sp.]
MNHLRLLKGTIIALVLLFIGFRLYLPTLLIQYAENRINRIPEYRVKIKDIDVNLIRGSYTIKQIALNKMEKNIPVPFFEANELRFSIHWRALLHGAIVAEIHAQNPVLNFVIEPNKQNEQLAIDKEWEQAVKSLFPLNINKVTINNGKIALHSFRGKPPFDLQLAQIDFHLDNLRKVSGSESLYSTFEGQGTMNQGAFSISGRVDPFAKQPTFLLHSTLKSMKIKGANDFLRHFIFTDVAAGEFSIYCEIAAKQGKIKGYAKPLIKHLKILNPDEKTKSPIEFLYKGVLEIGSKILTNHEKKTIATKVKIEGEIDDPDTSALSIIGYLLRNAFIQALLPQLDHSIELSDINYKKSHLIRGKG